MLEYHLTKPSAERGMETRTSPTQEDTDYFAAIVKAFDEGKFRGDDVHFLSGMRELIPPMVERACREDDDIARADAIEVLGMIGADDERINKALQAAMQSGDELVRHRSESQEREGLAAVLSGVWYS